MKTHYGLFSSSSFFFFFFFGGGGGGKWGLSVLRYCDRRAGGWVGVAESAHSGDL